MQHTFVKPNSVSTCQFFPYILLLVAVLMYTPALFWRFSAAPLLQSDLGFIMEELDRCYNRAVTLAKRLSTSGLLTPERYRRTPDVTFRKKGQCVKYPVTTGRYLLWLLCWKKVIYIYFPSLFFMVLSVLTPPPVTLLKAVSITRWWRSFWRPSVFRGCCCFTTCCVAAWLSSPCCVPASTWDTTSAWPPSRMSLAARCVSACLPPTQTSPTRCSVSSSPWESSLCSGICLSVQFILYLW